MPRLRFLRPSTGLGLEKRGIHPPIWSFIGRFYYLRLFAWLLPALISASLNLHYVGVTRAIDVCYLMIGTERYRPRYDDFYHAVPSPFLGLPGTAERRNEVNWS